MDSDGWTEPLERSPFSLRLELFDVACSLASLNPRTAKGNSCIFAIDAMLFKRSIAGPLRWDILNFLLFRIMAWFSANPSIKIKLVPFRFEHLSLASAGEQKKPQRVRCVLVGIVVQGF